MLSLKFSIFFAAALVAATTQVAQANRAAGAGGEDDEFDTIDGFLIDDYGAPGGIGGGGGGGGGAASAGGAHAGAGFELEDSVDGGKTWRRRAVIGVRPGYVSPPPPHFGPRNLLGICTHHSPCNPIERGVFFFCKHRIVFACLY
jgi:hypothetical protein